MSVVEDAVMKKIAERAAMGMRKYGCSVERQDLTRKQWLQHAQDEAMDLCVYLERLMREEQE